MSKPKPTHDAFLEKAQEEWKRLQKALKKNSDSFVLHQDLSFLYITIENTIDTINVAKAREQSTRQLKKCDAALKGWGKLLNAIESKFQLDSNKARSILAEKNITILQKALEKYPKNAFLHRKLDQAIDQVELWINDESENCPWKQLQQRADEWLRNFHKHHNPDLCSRQAVWIVGIELISSTSAPQIRQRLLKKLKEEKLAIEALSEKHSNDKGWVAFAKKVDKEWAKISSKEHGTASKNKIILDRKIKEEDKLFDWNLTFYRLQEKYHGLQELTKSDKYNVTLYREMEKVFQEIEDLKALASTLGKKKSKIISTQLKKLEQFKQAQGLNHNSFLEKNILETKGGDLPDLLRYLNSWEHVKESLSYDATDIATPKRPRAGELVLYETIEKIRSTVSSAATLQAREIDPGDIYSNNNLDATFQRIWPHFVENSYNSLLYINVTGGIKNYFFHHYKTVILFENIFYHKPDFTTQFNEGILGYDEFGEEIGRGCVLTASFKDCAFLHDYLLRETSNPDFNQGHLNFPTYNFQDDLKIFDKLLDSNNNYSDNYYLYCVLDEYSRYVKNFCSQTEQKKFTTWLKKVQKHHDLQLFSIENALNKHIYFLTHFKVDENDLWFRYLSDLEATIDLFGDAARQLVRTSPDAFRSERERFANLHHFVSDDHLDAATIAFDAHSGFIPDHLDSFIPEDPPHNSSDTINGADHREFYTRWSSFMDAFYNQYIPEGMQQFHAPSNEGYYGDKNEYLKGLLADIEWDPSFLGDNGVVPQVQKVITRGIRGSLTAPTQGWEKLGQLVQQGTTDVKLEETLAEIVKDMKLGNEISVKLYQKLTKLQQQGKKPKEILEVIRSELEKAYKAQNLWSNPDVQIGGLSHITKPLIVDPSSGFNVSVNNRPGFWVFESNPYNQDPRRPEDLHPFSVDHPNGIVVLIPGPQFNDKDIKKRGAYVGQQPGSTVIPTIPEDLYTSDQRPIEVTDHSNNISSSPIEFNPVIPEEQTDQMRIVQGWVKGKVKSRVHVRTVPQMMNRGQIVELPFTQHIDVGMSYRKAAGAEGLVFDIDAVRNRSWVSDQLSSAKQAKLVSWAEVKRATPYWRRLGHHIKPYLGKPSVRGVTTRAPSGYLAVVVAGDIGYELYQKHYGTALLQTTKAGVVITILNPKSWQLATRVTGFAGLSRFGMGLSRTANVVALPLVVYDLGANGSDHLDKIEEVKVTIDHDYPTYRQITRVSEQSPMGQASLSFSDAATYYVFHPLYQYAHRFSTSVDAQLFGIPSNPDINVTWEKKAWQTIYKVKQSFEQQQRQAVKTYLDRDPHTKTHKTYRQGMENHFQDKLLNILFPQGLGSKEFKHYTLENNKIVVRTISRQDLYKLYDLAAIMSIRLSEDGQHAAIKDPLRPYLYKHDSGLYNNEVLANKKEVKKLLAAFPHRTFLDPVNRGEDLDDPYTVYHIQYQLNPTGAFLDQPLYKQVSEQVQDYFKKLQPFAKDPKIKIAAPGVCEVRSTPHNLDSWNKYRAIHREVPGKSDPYYSNITSFFNNHKKLNLCPPQHTIKSSLTNQHHTKQPFLMQPKPLIPLSER